LETGWGITVRDMGSTSEMSPWATNAGCEHNEGVHVIQDEVWTEIVSKNDPHTGMPEGESGALVYSHLRRESQPMIRFYCGDESHMSYAPCPCGRSYPRLPAGIYGRLDDMLVIRGTNVYPSQVQRSLLEVPGAGVEFKIVLVRTGALDQATVRVEHDPALGGDAYADLQGAIQRKLRSDTGVKFEVEILPPNTLERALSKAKRVDDQRPKYRPEDVQAAS
jgi:phenylacetate-CoA ligase